MEGHGKTLIILTGVIVLCFPGLTPAINIVVDYRYDSQNFFDAPAKIALEAVAARYSAIITTSLNAVTLSDNGTDARIGFTHPGTGASWDVSPAASCNTDAVASCGQPDEAGEYRGPWSIGADDWILYAGGRSLPSAGQGGTGTGLNYTTVFSDGNSVLNRGFRPSGSVSHLPVWGGAITFDNDGGTNWHFDPNTVAPFGTTDFYTIALHEVGHVLGLSTDWEDWDQWSSGGNFSGTKAVAAYNADNGASVTSLSEVGGSNHHWQDGTYDSIIFPPGNPNYMGTVGQGSLQNLLMDPIANFTSSTKRFELTNVDVAALEDIGWSIISASSIACDVDNSGGCGLADINLMFAQGDLVTGVATTAGTEKFDLIDNDMIDGADITEWLALTGTQNGHGSTALRGDTDDLNNLSPTSRTVDITDFQNFLLGFTGAGATWEVGNFDGDSDVDITDFSIHFLPSFIATEGGSFGPGQAVPEPSAVLMIGLGSLLLAHVCWRR